MPQPKFCMHCGHHLMMRYPGGDPENGSASPRCRDNTHSTLFEEVRDATNDMDNTLLSGILAERFELMRNMEIIPEIVLRAGILSELLHLVDKKVIEFGKVYNEAWAKHDAEDEYAEMLEGMTAGERFTHQLREAKRAAVAEGITAEQAALLTAESWGE